MSTMPPGWYDDTRGALRWWDGRQWTEHVAVPDPEGTPEGDGPSEVPFELSELDDLDDSSESTGAFTSATDPQKSRLWIVWVVLGVVLLGVVIAAAVLIPLMFLGLTTGAGSASSQTVALVESLDYVLVPVGDQWAIDRLGR